MEAGMIRIVFFKTVDIPFIDLGFSYEGKPIYFPLRKGGNDIAFIEISKNGIEKHKYKIIPQPLQIVDEIDKEIKVLVKKEKFLEWVDKVKKEKLTKEDEEFLKANGI